ncbi:MAG: hypothetical protein H6Q03_1684 [Acidobacteria bacterium]|jgi:hypothetical protein|nr:hypothetical protein [Acidobacteriota bacterium]
MRLVSAVVIALAAALLAGGCRRASEPEAGREPAPLPTVDVSEPPDARASLEHEQVEQRRTESAVAGVLPSGFPDDVPLPQPSSLVDFGRGPLGGPSVTLEVQVSAAAAQRAYEARLAGAGFERQAPGLWRRGRRRIGVGVEPYEGAARVEVEILAGDG